MSIKSLEMLKMEKNFVAVIEKGYPRKPYEEYPIYPKHPDSSQSWQRSLLGFVHREMNELETSIEMLDGAIAPNVELTANVREEIADVSNTLDYLYESVLRLEMEWMQK